MIRIYSLLLVVLIAGCSTVKQKDYRPKTSKEKAAFERADFDVGPAEVQNDFFAYQETEVAWAGVIDEIQFNETERTIQVAFMVDHREFDWSDHGGGRPYHLTERGDGLFAAGWIVQKPARISFLKTLAKPGYMIVIYGKPYRLNDGVVQLQATAIRLVKDGDFTELNVEDRAEVEPGILPMDQNL